LLRPSDDCVDLQGFAPLPAVPISAHRRREGGRGRRVAFALSNSPVESAGIKAHRLLLRHCSNWRMARRRAPGLESAAWMQVGQPMQERRGVLRSLPPPAKVSEGTRTCGAEAGGRRASKWQRGGGGWMVLLAALAALPLQVAPTQNPSSAVAARPETRAGICSISRIY